AIWLRRPKAQIVALSLAAFALTASYLIGYATPSYHSDPLQFHRHLGAVAAYVATEIGNPASHIIRRWGMPDQLGVAQAFGAFGMALFALTAAALLRARRPAGASGPVFLATAVYVLGTAVLTALGRVRFGPEQALAPRYASPVLL